MAINFRAIVYTKYFSEKSIIYFDKLPGKGDSPDKNAREILLPKNIQFSFVAFVQNIYLKLKSRQ